jgi:hypothetical protein
VLSASHFLDHLVLDLSKANEKMIKIVNKHPLISLGVFTPPLGNVTSRLGQVGIFNQN